MATTAESTDSSTDYSDPINELDLPKVRRCT
jgi:hypothetical protein